MRLPENEASLGMGPALEQSKRCVLDRLEAPKVSDLACKLKVAVNPAPCGKHMYKSTNESTAAVRHQATAEGNRVPWRTSYCVKWKTFLCGMQRGAEPEKRSVKNQSTKHEDSMHEQA